MKHPYRSRLFPNNVWSLFSSSNLLGIPDLLSQDFDLPVPAPFLLRYRQSVRSSTRSRSLCHFFVHDYVMESTWSRPVSGLRHLSGYWGVLTPDFSLYRNYPVVLQQWNVYRSRWVGRFWQEAGLRVIPTMSWSTLESFPFCFLGVPRGSIVAVGVPSLHDDVAGLFEMGFRAMMRAVEPRIVVSYGFLPFSCSVAVECEKYGRDAV